MKRSNDTLNGCSGLRFGLKFVCGLLLAAMLISAAPGRAGDQSPPPPLPSAPAVPVAPIAPAVTNVPPGPPAIPRAAPGLLLPPGMPPAPVQPQEAADVKDMTNPAYLIELAQLHLRYNALERAEPLLRTALEKSKDAMQRQTVFSTLGMLLQRKGDWKSAVELYGSALQTGANPAERQRMQLSLGEAYVHTEEFEKAEKLFLEVSNGSAPNVPGSAPNMPGSASMFKQEALMNLRNLWQKQPGRLDSVIRESEEALAKDPKDAGALERLAEIYSGAKSEPAKAADYFEKLSALRPDDKAVQRRLIGFYQQSRQFDKAIGQYRKMMAVSASKEERAQNSFQVAQMLLQSGKKDEAVAWMTSDFAKDAASPHDFFLQAMFYEQAGMNTEAEAALLQAETSAKNPNEKAEFMLHSAEFELRRKEYAKAEERLQTIMKTFKDNPGVSSRANFAMKRLEREKNQPAPGAPNSAFPPNAVPPASPQNTAARFATPVPATAVPTTPAATPVPTVAVPLPPAPAPNATPTK